MENGKTIPQEERKTPYHIISILFDFEQKKELEEVSKAIGLNMSSFCRMKVLKGLREEQFYFKKPNVIEEEI